MWMSAEDARVYAACAEVISPIVLQCLRNMYPSSSSSSSSSSSFSSSSFSSSSFFCFFSSFSSSSSSSFSSDKVALLFLGANVAVAVSSMMRMSGGAVRRRWGCDVVAAAQEVAGRRHEPS